MVLFDWGTYNGLTKLRIAELLGFKLTEIPPRDFSKRNYGEEYFKKYGELAKEFKIIAHAPYYSLVSSNKRALENSRKALLRAIKLAELSNAEIFNLHLGGKLDDIDKTIEIAGETIKILLKNTRSIKISLETAYSKYLLGSIEEIKSIMEYVNSDRLLISLQLENDWMREFNIYYHGKFMKYNKNLRDFWYKILKYGLELGNGYLSLRFSQIIGIKLRGFVVKKRVPLGMGYPDYKELSKTIAEFLIKEIYYKNEKVNIHFIYTGIPQTKYKDTLTMYSEIMSNVVNYLR